MGVLSNLFRNTSAEPDNSSYVIPAPEVRPFGLNIRTCLSERYSARPVGWDGAIYWLSEADRELIDRSISFARDVAAYAASGRREARDAFCLCASCIKVPDSMTDINSYGIRTHSITVSTDAYTAKGNRRKYPLKITVPCTEEAKARRRSGGTSIYDKGTTVNMFLNWDGSVEKVDVIGVPNFRTRWTAKLKTIAGQLTLYRLERRKIMEDDFSVNKDSWDI